MSGKVANKLFILDSQVEAKMKPKYQHMLVQSTTSRIMRAEYLLQCKTRWYCEAQIPVVYHAIFSSDFASFKENTSSDLEELNLILAHYGLISRVQDKPS